MPHNPGHQAATALATMIGHLPMPESQYPEFEMETRLRDIRALREPDTPGTMFPGFDFAALWLMAETLEQDHPGSSGFQAGWTPVRWRGPEPLNLIVEPPACIREGMATIAVLVNRYDGTQMSFATVSVHHPQDGHPGQQVEVEGHCLDLETGAITDDGTQCTQQEWETMGPAWANLYGALARHPAIAAT